MPSDSGERRLAKPPPEQEHKSLPCPRCDSTNTKFCYYNNYNFSQPRHFCKSCRRYWTHGGTLRDIPVGGGTRKSSKRCRTAFTTSSSSSSILVSPLPFSGDVKPSSVNVCGSFTSLLNAHGPGLLALGGFGLGFGSASGLDDVGFGAGRGVWPFAVIGDGGVNRSGSGAGDGSVVGDTWQLGIGESGYGGGDCFSWPELAISTQGNNLK